MSIVLMAVVRNNSLANCDGAVVSTYIWYDDGNVNVFYKME